MLREIRICFFSGWKTGKLARVSALGSQLLIMLVQLTVMFSSASVAQASAAGTLPVWLAVLMFLMLAGLLLVSVYCNVLIITKRVRDLGLSYPVWLALLTYIANAGAFKLNLLLTGSLSDHNSPGLVQFSLYVVIIIWNLYLIAGRSR